MIKNLITFLKEEEGQGLSEYGIVGAIMAIAAVGAMTYLVPKIKSAFNKIGSQIDSGNSTTY